MTKVNQPSVPLEGRGSTESPRCRQESKGGGEGSGDQQHPDSKDPPPKSSRKALRGPSEGPQPGKRSCPKSPAQQETPPPRQTVGSKQPRKPTKGSTQAEQPQASSRVEGEAGPVAYGSKEQTSKDKPKVKTKGRPRAVGSREPKPEVLVPVPQVAVPKPQPPAPTPSEKRKHKNSTAPPQGTLRPSANQGQCCGQEPGAPCPCLLDSEPGSTQQRQGQRW